MELVCKTYLDNETGDFVAERYFMNGEEITEKEYCEILDAEEVDYNYEEDDYCDCDCELCTVCGLPECQCECENCIAQDELEHDEDGFVFEDEEDAEEFIDLVEDYVALIQETNGCPDCIRGLLVDMMLDFTDMFEKIED